jgi:hypothetical protein
MKTNTLKLEIYRDPTGNSGGVDQDLVRILIDGQDLLELITDAQVGYREAHHLELGSNPDREPYDPKTQHYVGLYASKVFLPSRRFLGNARETDHTSQHDNGKICLLMCGCGIEGCGSIAARITVSGQIVVWDAFEDHYNTEWDLSCIGPFIFDRQQYLEELRKHNPQRMILAMAELKPCLINKAAVYDVEHYYIDEAKTGEYFEVWKNLQNSLATIYYVQPGQQEVRIKVGEQYHQPENILPAIIQYADRWGYKIKS